MLRLVKSMAVVLFATACLSACAISPRTSSWDSPKKFTKAQVFNAALQAGGQNGYTTSASDRESGTMSFTRRIADGNMIHSIQISEVNGIIQVRTTANFAGDIAVAGTHEEEIRHFHTFLFRNLNIADATELKNVQIQEAK